MTSDARELCETDKVWALKGGCQADRMAALRAAAEIVLARGRGWNRVAVREEGIAECLVKPAWCFGCGTSDLKLYWHHIITIQHGGSNHPRNIVPICHECHRAIHPWLRDSRNEVRGWMHVSAVSLPTLEKLEKPWKRQSA